MDFFWKIEIFPMNFHSAVVVFETLSNLGGHIITSFICDVHITVLYECSLILLKTSKNIIKVVPAQIHLNLYSISYLLDTRNFTILEIVIFAQNRVSSICTAVMSDFDSNVL